MQQLDPSLSSVTKFYLWLKPPSEYLELCLRLFPKLDALKFYSGNYFDESDDDSNEETNVENIPLKSLENLSRIIPYIQFEDFTVRSGEET